MPATPLGQTMQSNLLVNQRPVGRRFAWQRHLLQWLVVAAASAASALPATAQWRVGGFLGGEHDSSWDEFLVIGADARGAVGAMNIELNPRISYFVRDLTTRIQLDFNVIKPLTLASSSKLLPFIGAGLALERVSYDNALTGGTGAGTNTSESNVGFNYIVGSTLKVSGRVQPFAQFTYSVLNEAANSAVITFGVHFKLGGTK